MQKCMISFLVILVALSCGFSQLSVKNGSGEEVMRVDDHANLILGSSTHHGALTTHSITILQGAADGRVLKSNASGEASWGIDNTEDEQSLSDALSDGDDANSQSALNFDRIGIGATVNDFAMNPHTLRLYIKSNPNTIALEETSSPNGYAFMAYADPAMRITSTKDIAFFIDSDNNQTDAKLNIFRNNPNMNSPGEVIHSFTESGALGVGGEPTFPLHVVSANGAYCSSGGVWVDGSSREFKENINEIALEQAYDALDHLDPVSYNYKNEKNETYLGFIAEDVPELVAMNNRKYMNPMDVVALLTKIVKDQNEKINKLVNLVEKR